MTAEHGRLHFLEDFHHLANAGHGGVDEVVPEQHGKGLVSDERLRHRYGVTEAEGFFLAHVGDADEIRDSPDDVELLALVFLLEEVFELEGNVEVIFDSALAPPGHDDDVGDARADRLLDDVLNERFVDQRQHLFGLGLGGGKEPGPQARGRKNCLANLHQIDAFLVKFQ